MRNISNDKGIALVMAIVMLVTLTILGLAALMTSRLNLMVAANERFAAEAMNAADAGIEKGFLDLTVDIKNDEVWGNDNFITMSTGTQTTLTNSTAYVPTSLAFANVTYPSDDSTVEAAAWGDPFNGTYGHAWNLYGTQTLGDAKYTVLLLRDPAESNEVYLRSYAELETDGEVRARKILQLHLKVDYIDSWRNAIFAGHGQAASVMKGNFEVGGPIHILGVGNADTAFAMKGSSALVNGYQNLGTDPDSHLALKNRIPDIEQDASGNDTLETTVRVKRGKVDIDSLSVEIGQDGQQTDDAGGHYKGSLDALLLNDGFTSDSKNIDIYADKVAEENGYDLGDKIQMPTFQDLYDPDTQVDRNGNTCSDCDTYKDYIQEMSTDISPYDSASGTGQMKDKDGNPTCSLSAGDPTNANVTQFFNVGYVDSGGSPCTSATDPDSCSCPATENNGCIMWNPNPSSGKPNIKVDGRIEIDGSACSGIGSDFYIGTDAGTSPPGGSPTITYEGKGLLYSPVQTWVDTDFLSREKDSDGTQRKFADDDIMGLMVEGSMRLTEKAGTPKTLMGAFYASDMISANKASTILGTISSNFFCMSGIDTSTTPPTCTEPGGGTPFHVYYVKQLSGEVKKLGMLRSDEVWTFPTWEWEEIY